MLATIYTPRAYFQDIMERDYNDSSSPIGKFLRTRCKVLVLENLPLDVQSRLQTIYGSFPVADVIQGRKTRRITSSELDTWLQKWSKTKLKKMYDEKIPYSKEDSLLE